MEGGFIRLYHLAGCTGFPEKAISFLRKSTIACAATNRADARISNVITLPGRIATHHATGGRQAVFVNRKRAYLRRPLLRKRRQDGGTSVAGWGPCASEITMSDFAPSAMPLLRKRSRTPCYLPTAASLAKPTTTNSVHTLHPARLWPDAGNSISTPSISLGMSIGCELEARTIS